jgi:cation:H+ antiporter
MYVACTALIVFSGAKLSRYGDILAGKTGLGRTWIGVVLMASVTSLPELITGLSSVTYAGVPDIAVGDALGSCAFNLLILAADDFFYLPGPLLSHVDPSHAVSAISTAIMAAIAVIGFTYRADKKRLWLAWDSIGMVAVYLVNLLILFSMSL